MVLKSFKTGWWDGKGGRPLLVECGSEGNMMNFFLKSFLKMWFLKGLKGGNFRIGFVVDFWVLKIGFLLFKK